jgi:BirA family biotin operon repressor/biotin-[acetyl-CoA-carboxylase] ligase
MPIGEPLIHLVTTTSTMDEVAERAVQGMPEGLVVLADEQTSGRGRAGRGWTTAPGLGLTFSVLLRPVIAPDRITTLPLVLGIAVAEAVEQTALVRCDLKWPNDVLLGGHKLAGILITSRLQPSGLTVVAGIGLNVNETADDLPLTATSLLTTTGRTFKRLRLLRRVCDRIDHHYRMFLETDGRPDLSGWSDRAWLLDELVSINDNQRTVTGRMLGIDEQGALQIEHDGVVERIVAGDLTRGPRPAS